VRFDPAFVYTTSHGINERMSDVIALGFRAEKRRAALEVVGAADRFEVTRPKPESLSLFYGILRGTGEVMRLCEEAGGDYIYVDHSYFDETRVKDAKVDQRTHFRCVPNDRYFRRGGDMPADRWLRLGIEVRPWRTSGDHIVIVPVSRFVAAFNGFSPEDWLAETVETLRQHTDRKIVVKPKDVDHPLTDVLENAWALVTLESNAAIQAALAGIPVFTGVSAAAAPFGSQFLDEIENPPMPEREQHLANLAYQQFTYAEIGNGTARFVLQEQFGG
jgi:hypothetical protein